MATEFVNCPDGTWQIHHDLVRTIVKSYVKSCALIANSGEVVNDGQGEKWLYPNVYAFETNWPSVHQEVSQVPRYIEEIIKRAVTLGGADAQKFLGTLESTAATNMATVRSRQQSAYEKSMDGMNKRIEWGEFGLKTARVTRDLSKDLFIVGLTVVTGGGAGAVLLTAGTNGVLEGLTKAQDTDGPGATRSAVFKGMSSFAIGLIPAGKLFKGVTPDDKVFLLILQETAKAGQAFTQAIVDGDTGEEAVKEALLSAGSSVIHGGARKLLQGEATRRALRRYVYPATLRIDYHGRSNYQQVRRGVEFTRGAVTASGAAIGKGGVALSQALLSTRPDERTTRPKDALGTALIASKGMARRAIEGPVFG